jgi:hypothetical protein
MGIEPDRDGKNITRRLIEREKKMEKGFKITFTSKPKGLRFNTELSRDVNDKGIEYFQITMKNKSLILRPADYDKYDKTIFKVSHVAGEVVFIAAAALHNQAVKAGLVGDDFAEKVDAVWNKRKGCYECDLTGYNLSKIGHNIILPMEGGENPLLKLTIKPFVAYKEIKQTSPEGNWLEKDQSRFQPNGEDDIQVVEFEEIGSSVSDNYLEN